MSDQRKRSSSALGKDTLSTREQIEFGELDGEQIAALKGVMDNTKSELLARSVMGVEYSSRSSEDIHSCILKEGFNYLTIQSMGGMLHLIFFDTIEDKVAMMECKWLQTWFMKLTNIDETSAPLWRETILSIYGVPLSAWSHENFYKIGCVYGLVLSVDYSRSDHARVKIFTDCFFKINNQILLDVGEKRFPVFVFEDSNNHHMPSTKNPKLLNQSRFNLVGDDSDKSNDLVHSPQSQHHDESPLDLDNPPLQLLTATEAREQPINSDELAPSPKSDPPHSNSLTTDHRKISHTPNITFNDDVISDTNNESPNLQPPPNDVSRTPNHYSPPNNENNFPIPQKSKRKNPKTKSPNPSHSLQYRMKTTIALVINPSPLNEPSQPIPTSNQFSPLFKPPSLVYPSSSLSEIPFLPGFEANIPSPIKANHVMRRIKKIQKGQRGKNAAQNQEPKNLPFPPNSPSNHSFHPNTLKASDIINLGLQLGLHYDGPISELEDRISNILSLQKSKWDKTQ